MRLEGGEDEAVGGQPSGRAVQNGTGGGLGSLLGQPRAHRPAFGVLVIDVYYCLFSKGRREIASGQPRHTPKGRKCARHKAGPPQKNQFDT